MAPSTARDSSLQDLVAKAYAAVAEPEAFVTLIEEVVEAEHLLGSIDNSAELHFDNARSIMEKMYPAADTNHSAFTTHGKRLLTCDLALSRDLRVLHAASRVFGTDALHDNNYAPDWLFGNDNPREVQRKLAALSPDDRYIFLRLQTGEAGEIMRWFAASAANHEGQDIVNLDVVRVRWDDAGAAAFQSAFALTDTELALVHHLIVGGTTRSFAELRGRSVGTARNQMKALQRKLSISSKEDLLLLFAGFLHAMQTRQSAKGTEWHECEQVFTASDGSTIAYEEFGDLAGKPVLYFHLLSGPLLSEKFTDAARAAGLRIIAPWRPHYGKTSGIKPGKRTPQEFARRMPEFLAHLGIQNPLSKLAGLATQAGMPYLMAMVQEHPEMLHGALGVGPYLPMSDAADYEFLAPRQRNHIRVGRIAPAFVRVYMRAMLASIGTGMLHRFVEDYYAECPHDLAAAQSATMMDIFQRNSSYGTIGGSDGAIDTNLNWSADWSDLLRDSKVPVTLMVGEHDSSTPPAFARQTAAKYGLEASVVVDGENSFLLFEQPEPVMAQLVAMSA